MRILYVLSVLVFSYFTVNAQITLEEEPLESNLVLQRLHKKSQEAHNQRLRRLFGTATSANSRNLGILCDDDGVYENGETVYVESGDSIRICLDTIGFATMTNISIDGNHGTASIDSSCIIYQSFEGIDLGLNDTMIVELCLPDNGECINVIFPVVVKRAGRTYIEDHTTLGTEEEAILCADPANIDLPGGIFFSRLLECHDPKLAAISNGNEQDSCLLLTSQRFAGGDTVCVQIGNFYCICDTFKFPFNVVGDTLDLPFMDDFSSAGPYPESEWLDIHTFVNNKWSKHPPSVGFATFDGLDATGTPYGPPYGRADFLTSNYLDLSPPINNVYLSFYFEPKGLGYQPNEFQGDSLVLEFKNDLGDWVYIDAYDALASLPLDSVPPWQFRAYPITSDEYLYRGFQFRFVNYAARQGIIDIWHIDYVRLTANEIPDTTFEDIAFTAVPNSILKRYSNMPYRHFVGNEAEELITDIDIELFSQFSDTTLAEPSDLTITELMNDVVVHYDETLLEDPLTQRNVPPFEHKHHVNPIDFDPFPVLVGDSLIFETQYTFNISAQNPGLFPQVERNDTVRQKTYMTNLFSYDDGSAETAMKIGLAQQWAIAVEFKANIDDTLRAIQIHFPHYNDAQQEGAKFNIQVFVGIDNLESTSVPVFEKLFEAPFYVDSWLDSLQGYTTYRLNDDFDQPSPVFIPEGKFYIALQQATSIGKPVRIGLDKNTPEARPYQFIFNGFDWSPLGNNGAAMLRAVVGDYTPGSTPVNDLSVTNESVKVYPNPSTGILNFEFENSSFDNYTVSVFNTTGQLIFQQKLDSPSLDLSNQNDGIYFLKFDNLKNKTSFVRKVFINKRQ
jgi:Secretion system C-terminal sorting domain